MAIQSKNVTLTFDDGPNPPYTNQILDILKKENIKAIFFVCGANIKRHPEIIKRQAKEDHIVANHSYNHSYIPTILGLTFGEIITTQKLIDNLISQKAKFYKGPWCNVPIWIKNKLEKVSFTIVPCGAMGNDWEDNITSDEITHLVTSRVADGGIITLHDGHNTEEGADRSKTVIALPRIIKSLKEKGYQFILPQN